MTDSQAKRIPKHVDESLGQDRRFAGEFKSVDELHQWYPNVYPKMDALIEAGWDVLKPPTVTLREDKVLEFEAILTTKVEP